MRPGRVQSAGTRDRVPLPCCPLLTRRPPKRQSGGAGSGWGAGSASSKYRRSSATRTDAILSVTGAAASPTRGDSRSPVASVAEHSDRRPPACTEWRGADPGLVEVLAQFGHLLQNDLLYSVTNPTRFDPPVRLDARVRRQHLVGHVPLDAAFRPLAHQRSRRRVHFADDRLVPSRRRPRRPAPGPAIRSPPWELLPLLRVGRKESRQLRMAGAFIGVVGPMRVPGAFSRGRVGGLLRRRNRASSISV